MKAIFGEPGAGVAAFDAADGGGAAGTAASPGGFTESDFVDSGTGITVIFGPTAAAAAADGAAAAGETWTGAAVACAGAAVGAAGIRIAGIATCGPPGATAGAAGTDAGAAETEIRGAAMLPASCCAMSAFVSSVRSCPQAGQRTGPGDRPFTGSTSNLNFAPQPQRILISIRIDRPLQEGNAPAAALVLMVQRLISVARLTRFT